MRFLSGEGALRANLRFVPDISHDVEVVVEVMVGPDWDIFSEMKSRCGGARPSATLHSLRLLPSTTPPS